MDKIDYEVIKPFSVESGADQKRFNQGETLPLSPLKAAKLIETGHLCSVPVIAEPDGEIELTPVTADDSLATNLLESFHQRTKTLYIDTGIPKYAADSIAAEATISTLKRIKSLASLPEKPSIPIDLLNRKSKNRFNQESTKKGAGEWAQYTYNIAKGCPNACLYCFAKADSKRHGRIKSDADWADSTTLLDKTEIFQKIDGTVMFPSTHDITSDNLEAYMKTLTNILQSGNKVLVVSKPSLACIQPICEKFKPYIEAITLRFTIGTTDEAVAKILEPNAPTPEERIDCLKHAYESGFTTSVSAEPMLGGIQTALSIYSAVEPYVIGDIWFGKVNRSPVKDRTTAELEVLDWIKQEHSNEKIRVLHGMLKDQGKVRWKDSIQDVIAKS